MAKLHAISTEPSADLLETLEALTEQVKSGEVVGMAWATVARDGSGATGWVYGGSGSRLVGIVSRLLYRMNVMWDEE